jgi:hypothetical protein
MQQAYARPPYQVAAQPILAPLPPPLIGQPVLLPTTPATATSTQPAAVTLVADPQTIASGHRALLSWGSVGTIGCVVKSQDGTQIGSTTPAGDALSAALSTTTAFTAICVTPTSTTVEATTSVTVQ